MIKASDFKIGILYCAYNCKNYASSSLQPFISAREEGLIYQISAVSLPFLEYLEIESKNDGTDAFLSELLEKGSIDKLFTQPKHIREHEARDLCLQYLNLTECDAVWLVDGDEFYTLNDIENIIKFVKDNPEHCWYSINFKNYIFDGKQWIDGFCPSRIFKTKFDNLTIDCFYWDNDILYKDPKNNKFNYKNLSNLEIPKDITHIKHMTWLHENGKHKYEYQMKHFGHCGYKWNYDENKLEFDKNFYLKIKQELPNIYYEN